MITKEAIAKNAACNAIVDLIDIGSDASTGYLSIFDSDSTVITSLNFSDPAFGDSSDGTALAGTIQDSTALVDGTASTFTVFNRDSTSIYSGSVAADSSGDMVLDSIVIPQDTTISLASATYIVP